MVAASRRRRFDSGASYWPGFVDAMATLLLVIIFLLTVFMLAQFLLAREISGRDTVLTQLRSQLAELTDLLALEQAGSRSLQASLAGLSDDLASAEAERTRLTSLLTDAEADRAAADEQVIILQDRLDAETDDRISALAEVEESQRTIVDLRSEAERRATLLASLAEERDQAVEARDEALARATRQEAVIVDLRSEAERQQAALALQGLAVREAESEADRATRRLTALSGDIDEAEARAEEASRQLVVLASELDQTEADREAALARLREAQDELIVIQGERERELARLRGELVAANTRADDAEGALEERDDQGQLIIDLRNERDRNDQRISSLSGSLASAESERDDALRDLELLNFQLAALRRQLGALQLALDASEERDVEAQAQIADLGRRLNVALAQKVKELARYRSEFFGRLREILSDRSDIRVVGDRFVFQSEVLFPTASATINPAGRDELEKLGQALVELEGEIPPELNWVLRVDGHTDQRAISTAAFQSNWELSSARAISVVQFLIAQGVPPNRLVAAGFGEFQPLESGESEEAFARNRRIELKLTER